MLRPRRRAFEAIGILVAVGCAALAPAPAQAQQAVTIPDPILTCRTLSELRLWDNKQTPSDVLQRTIQERTCRNLPGGTLATVAERATLEGTPYECLKVENEPECLWAGAVSPLKVP